MTTHVFIVDHNTFKYHLEYMFAGTGSKDDIVDFNNSSNTNLHHTTENKLLGMIADIKRIRIGDLIVFYLQQDIPKGILEGKFYGIFQVTSEAFLDNNDDRQFLKQELNKSLTFRVKIAPYQVYSQGVTEWKALDEIQHIISPCQMLWSLIYRKLKGNRGNTMITPYESDRLIALIRCENNRQTLNGHNFTFNENTQEIQECNDQNLYTGRTEYISIFNRLKQKFDRNNQFETHLQSYILEHIHDIPYFNNMNIEFLGNEVSCGVGMQRIDILVSSTNQDNSNLIIPIELKSCEVYPNIINQMQRYIDWLEQYYLPNQPNSDIQPIIIARKTNNRQTNNYLSFIAKTQEFNQRNSRILDLKYIEFEVTEQNIIFNEIF